MNARLKKQESAKKILSLVKECSNQNDTALIVGFNALTVAQMNYFRVLVREHNAKIIVGKRRIIARALNQGGFNELAEYSKGRVAVICSKDSFGAAVAVEKFDDNKKLFYVGGMIDGKCVSVASIKSVAKYGSKEMVIAAILSAMRNRFATVLQMAKLAAEKREL